MSCRDEFATEENGVAEERLLREMRLARIADVWQYRRTLEYNQWVTEYNRRVEALNEEARQQQDFDEKYLVPWIEELEALDDELADLLEKWKAGEDVTPADWDAVTAGKERKAIHIVHYDLPKESWPLPVREQFPNLIALFKHDWEVRLEGCRQKQYAHVIKDIANSSPVTESLCYKERYRNIVKHFVEQGAITVELKRLAGDTSDGVGWQTPMTAEQIEQMREQLEADQARFEQDVDGMLLDHLRYEDVMSQDFDAHLWVRKIFQEQDLSTTSEAIQRAAQMVHAWVDYWQKHAGGEANDSGADHVASDSPPARSCDAPYDRAHLDDGREPDLDVDITKTLVIDYEDELCLPVEPDFDRMGKAPDKNINHEDGLFLPVEPVLDQFGMDLDDETEHTVEYFLPFDT